MLVVRPCFVYVGDNALADLGLVSTKLHLQVAVNTLKLARSLTVLNRVVFAPSFERSSRSNLSLGILTKMLHGASTVLISAQEKSEMCRRRLDSIQDMTTQQLAELLPPDTDEKLPAQVRRMIGAKTLEQELKSWEELLELCSLVLESTTWLLWHHMEQYLQQKKMLILGGGASIITTDDFQRLKKEIPNHLNAILFKKLNECEQVRCNYFGYIFDLFKRITFQTKNETEQQFSPFLIISGLFAQERSPWFCSSPASSREAIVKCVMSSGFIYLINTCSINLIVV